jgi:hypothetical protein
MFGATYTIRDAASQEVLAAGIDTRDETIRRAKASAVARRLPCHIERIGPTGKAIRLAEVDAAGHFRAV